MWRLTAPSRALTLGPLILACSAGLLPMAGCGESEAPIASTDKKRDDLQKDIENPYGVEVKQPKPGSRSRR
ncbi:hypothetical protein [Paludisphaera soli]|uniref:hypothetical protein n=1 Tax=Paludisphaera soli TaxID=2712865 RepID=UPI0013EDB164|nr:hypothetical protein [Paludisphaera soli]